MTRPTLLSDTRFGRREVHRQLCAPSCCICQWSESSVECDSYKLKEPTLNASNVSLITTSLNLLVPGRNGPRNMFLHHCQQSIQIERHRDDDRTSRIVRGAAQRFARCLTMERPSRQSNVYVSMGKILVAVQWSITKIIVRAMSQCCREIDKSGELLLLSQRHV